MYVFIADRGALLDFVMTMRESGTLKEAEYVVLAADVALDLGEDGCGKYILPAWTTRRDTIVSFGKRMCKCLRKIIN